MSALNAIIQTSLVLWLCWEAFNESERADHFEKLSKEILENNENLIKLNSELYEKLKELGYKEPLAIANQLSEKDSA